MTDSSSDRSHRRSYLTSHTEEKPTASSSTIPKTTTETESDTKKRSRSFLRPQLRSAVPDSQILSFAQRPAQSGQRKTTISN